MIKDYLQKELDKKKYFVVRYAFVINLLIIGIIVLLLCILKIDNQPIFSMFMKYYFK